MPVIYIIGVNACYAIYLYHFKDVGFWQAARQAFSMTLSFLIIMLLSLPLIFACFLVGRLINRARARNKQ